MIKKKWLAVILAVLITATSSIMAFADEISDKKDQLGDVQDRIEDLKGEIKSLEDKIDENVKQVKTVEASIADINSDIDKLQAKINEVENDIDVAAGQLDEAIAQYNEQDDRMTKRMNVMYKNSTSIGYIQIILESKSFADFLARADLMKKIVNYDMNMLKDMKDKREQIDKQKTELEQYNAELAGDKAALNTKKSQLVSQKKSLKNLISRNSMLVSQKEKEKKAEEETAKKIQKEIQTLMDKKKKYSGVVGKILHLDDFPSGKYPRITSEFGSRVDPITGKKGAFHSGLDIGTAGVTNIPVYAMAEGTVIIARWYGGYGYCVVIDHGSGIATLYGHNNKLLVKEGDKVSAGQKISLSGSTGRSTGPHVHFGVQKNGDWVDPTPYLKY